jgi:hypothetical protein
VFWLVWRKLPTRLNVNVRKMENCEWAPTDPGALLPYSFWIYDGPNMRLPVVACRNISKISGGCSVACSPLGRPLPDLAKMPFLSRVCHEQDWLAAGLELPKI